MKLHQVVHVGFHRYIFKKIFKGFRDYQNLIPDKITLATG